ncbi:hypothetical protein PtB15_14B221 [Puccinia triticina]|nr:hypothetical protein PtB15_14B221 [Puccinia triticina]
MHQIQDQPSWDPLSSLREVMSNSTSKELDAGGERLTIIKLQDHADLVADGFKSLKNKYDPDPYYSYPRPALKDWTNPTDHEVDKKRDILRRLQSSILPQLALQIRNLSPLLDPTRIRENPALQFDLILAIQLEFDEILSQIRCAGSV